jgi:hypothetical protein
MKQLAISMALVVLLLGMPLGSFWPHFMRLRRIRVAPGPAQT